MDLNNTSVTILNDTIVVPRAQVWTFLPSFSLAVLLLAIITNGTVLYLFFRHRQLRTPFTVYIINLLSANLLTMLIQVPIYLVANLEPYWWIGRTACNLYIYGFFLQAGMCNSHALISLNRLWAVVRPISYRQRHTKRTAWSISGIMWVYVHVMTFPGFIADILYYRLPEETYGCFLNKNPQPAWAVIHQFVVFNLPVLVIVVTYPVVCYHYWHRGNRKRPIKVTPLEVDVQASKGTEIVTLDRAPSRGDCLTGEKETMSRKRVAVPRELNNDSNVGSPYGRRLKSRGFLVLTFVTFGMLVFWLPSMVFYTVIVFHSVEWQAFQQAGTVLWFIQSVADPVMFMLALSDLQDRVRRLLHL